MYLASYALAIIYLSDLQFHLLQLMPIIMTHAQAFKWSSSGKSFKLPIKIFH